MPVCLRTRESAVKASGHATVRFGWQTREHVASGPPLEDRSMKYADLPKSRPVSYSAVREQAYMVFPNDLNSNDTVFGGLIMALMDRFSATAADRHAGGIC